MHKVLPALFITLIAIFFPLAAKASETLQRTVLLAVGPYVVNVSLATDPPFTDQPNKILVVPEDRSLQLQGEVIARPGLGTDAVDIHARLKPAANNTLQGQISIPVRGAWQIVVALDGPQGHGEGSFSVTVAAPGAIPVWLGWLIGMTPILGIGWWFWHQHRYRRILLQEQTA